MKFQLTFSLDKAEIPTKDYRRIFASIIKNALSRYMDGQLFEKFYKDTETSSKLRFLPNLLVRNGKKH